MVRATALYGSSRQGKPGWKKKKHLHLAQAVTSRSVSGCPSTMVQADCLEEGTVACSRQSAQTMQDGPAACQVTMKPTGRDRNSSSHPQSVVTHTAHSCPLSRPRSLGAVPDPWK